MSETTVSGAIKFQPDSSTKDGGTYAIRNRNGSGWGIPTNDITPEDLRAMADHLEAQRAEDTGAAEEAAYYDELNRGYANDRI